MSTLDTYNNVHILATLLALMSSPPKHFEFVHTRNPSTAHELMSNPQHL